MVSLASAYDVLVEDVDGVTVGEDRASLSVSKLPSGERSSVTFRSPSYSISSAKVNKHCCNRARVSVFFSTCNQDSEQVMIARK